MYDNQYVMLMLERASALESEADECDDPLVIIACLAGDDSCPAACVEENGDDDEDNEVVKSGSLVVTAEGYNGNLFIGRASELDSLTFKTSEEVTISKIILERQGYSTRSNIRNVRLEDENGAKITDPKPLDSKGQAKLSLKKDYKVVDGELNAVIVVETASWSAEDVAAGLTALTAGATVGFKVVNVESTAEDIDLPSKAYNYTAIVYDGSSITLSASKAATKDYNFTAGNMYEVAKFKVQTPDDSSIDLKERYLMLSA